MSEGAALRRALFVVVILIVAVVVYAASYLIFIRGGTRGDRMQAIHVARSMSALGPAAEHWDASLKITTTERGMYWTFLPCYRLDWWLRRK